MLIIAGDLCAQQNGSFKYTQQYGSFEDPRDGKAYKTTKIGDQVWMVENLDVSVFRNGDIIPEAKSFEQWAKAGENKQPAWCYFNNDPSTGSKFGKLYNWYAINDPRGLAPMGWHIPSDIEWSVLQNKLGGEEDAVEHLISKKDWPVSFLYGKNKSGFTALPGGKRKEYGDFEGVGKLAAWWSSTESNYITAWISQLEEINETFITEFKRVNYYKKASGFSVRCIKD